MMMVYSVGNSVADSFIAAFVHVKVEEIISQLSSCFNCTCTPSGPSCTPSSLCEGEPGALLLLYCVFIVCVCGAHVCVREREM